MSDKDQLATFRVESELWESFKMQARRAGRTASDVLNEFVQNYAQAGAAATEAHQSVLDDLESRIEIKVAEAIAPIRAELEELKLKLDSSDMRELTAALNNKRKSA